MKRDDPMGDPPKMEIRVEITGSILITATQNNTGVLTQFHSLLDDLSVEAKELFDWELSRVKVDLVRESYE